MFRKIAGSTVGTLILVLCLFFGPLGLSYAVDVKDPAEETTEAATEAPVEIQEESSTAASKENTEDTKEAVTPRQETEIVMDRTEAGTFDEFHELWYTGENASFFVAVKNAPERDCFVKYSINDSGKEQEAVYEKKTDTFKISMEEGNNVYQVTVCDSEGNTVTTQTFTLAYDKTKPEESIYVKYYDDRESYEENPFSDEKGDGDYFFKDRMVVDLFVKDGGDTKKTSKIAKVSACLLKKDGSRTDLSFTKQDGELQKIDGTDYEIFRAFVSETLEEGSIRIDSVTDTAGNERTFGDGASGSAKLFVDTDTPVIRSAFDGFLNNEEYYDEADDLIVSGEDISPSYTVEESFFGKGHQESYSYELKSLSGDNTVYDKKDSSVSGDGWQGQTYIPGKSGILSGKEGEETGYEAVFTYVDPVGNEVQSLSRVVIDKKAPQISRVSVEGSDQSKSYDTNRDGETDRLYLYNEGGKGKFSVSFHLEEFRLSGKEGDIYVSCKDLKQNVSQTYNCEVIPGEDGYECSVQIEPETEGEWSLCVFAKDKAGNLTEEAVDLLVISDFTAPVFSVSYDVEDSFRQKGEVYYSQEPITVLIEISDENLRYTDSGDRSLFINGESADDSVFKLSEDGRKLTCSFSMSLEQSYSYELSFKDPSGNGLKDQDNGIFYSPEFIIDLTDPVVTMEISETPEGEEGQRVYYGEPVLVKITVTDQNFNPDDFAIGSEAFTYSVSAVCEKDRDETVRISGSDLLWEQEGHVFKTSFAVEEEANYTYSYECQDLSGRTAKKEEDRFSVDQTKPVVQIVDLEGTDESDILFSEKQDFKKLLEFINYKNYAYFGDRKCYMAVIAHDAVSGVKEIRYEIHDTEKQTVEEGTLISSGYGKYVGIIALEENFKGYVKAGACDRSDNQSDLKTPRGIVTENLLKHNETKNIEISIPGKYSNKSGNLCYYNGPVKVNLSVSDSYSGIKSYEYSGGEAVHGEKNFKKSYGTKDDPEEAGNNVYEFKDTITLEAGDVNYSSASDPTVIRLSYEDNAGHEESEKKTIVIDDQKPQITVTYESKAAVQNGKYYNKDRVAHVVINERNFDKTLVKWLVSGSGSGADYGEWTHSGDTHSCEIRFSADGTYQLNFSVTDLAGNKNSYTGEEFVIDQTAPVLSITFDKNDAANGKYFNAVRTATIHVREENFSAENCHSEIRDASSDQSLKSPAPGNWYETEGEHQAKIVFSEDGGYLLSFSFTDLAGNQGEKVTADAFVIDRTAPQIEIGGVSDHCAYNDKVNPVIGYSDVNLKTGALVYRFCGNKNPDFEAKVLKEQESSTEGMITFKDFERSEDRDDIYTLSVSVTDLAGNETKKSIVFSVNRFGSNYSVSDETGRILDTFYLKNEENLTVCEINTDELKEQAIYVTDENNNIKMLTEGSDYQIKQERDSYGWKQYTYEIAKKVFSEEGFYSVRIESKDAAGNRISNVIKDQPLKFVVDKTSPALAVNGLEKRIYKDSSHKIYLEAFDNNAVKSLEVYVDGKLYQSYDGESLEKTAGRVSFSLKEKKTQQEIRFVITDAAGNCSEEEEYTYHCLVTTSGLWRFLFFFVDIFS